MKDEGESGHSVDSAKDEVRIYPWGGCSIIDSSLSVPPMQRIRRSARPSTIDMDEVAWASPNAGLRFVSM